MKAKNTLSIIPNDGGLLDMVIVIKITDVVKIANIRTADTFDDQVKQIKDKISGIKEK
jgi:hypothetical protein